MITIKGVLVVILMVIVNAILIAVPVTAPLAWLWIIMMIFGSLCTLFIDHITSMPYHTSALLLFEDESECDEEFCPEND